jgi:hypothetical protein
MPLEATPATTTSPTEPVAAPAAAPAAPPPTGAAPHFAAPQSPQPPTVTIPLEQLQTFTSIQARLAQVESEQRARDEAARAEQVKLLAAKGQIEEALQRQNEENKRQIDAERSQRAALEERAKRYALDGELSKVLASQPLVPGGAEQLTQLWRSQFQVEPQGESFQVRTPTFQSVADFVTSHLSRPEYAHFIRAQNPAGGTGGTTGAHQAGPTPPQTPPPAVEPKTFGEAIILQMQELRKSQPTDNRVNLAVPMGLNSRSITRNA